jgi:hypothetical protein
MMRNTRIHCPSPQDDDDTIGTVLEDDYQWSSNQSPSVSMKSCVVPFPWKLHEMLDDAEKEGFDSVVSWLPGNKNTFRVHDSHDFVKTVMSRYFNQTKYKSFQRQLNLWGFRRVPNGPERGGYEHSCFIRNEPRLCRHIRRRKIKGKKPSVLVITMPSESTRSEHRRTSPSVRRFNDENLPPKPVSSFPAVISYESLFVDDQDQAVNSIDNLPTVGCAPYGTRLEDDFPCRERLEGSMQSLLYENGISRRFSLGISSQQDQDTTSRGNLQEWLEIHSDKKSLLLDVFPADFDPESIFS